jgi:glycosyltransferase involved in cell wall biosynthesis
MNKIKVVAFCDTPVVSTGFATVSRNILSRMEATGKYDITVWGINHYGMPYDHHKYPYPIYPAPINERDDPYGRQEFMKLIARKEFDILWSLQDPFIMRFLGQDIDKIRSINKKNFKWIFYSSLDHEPIQDWVSILSKSDYPVMWNQWALNEVLKSRPELKFQFKKIYFGVDTKIFKPLTKEEVSGYRDEYFAIPQVINDKTFIITNVNRNQRRKDWLRTLLIFKKFKEARPDSFLYMHTKADDDHNLDMLAGQMDLKPLLDYGYPDQALFIPGQEYTGVKPEELNKIYNISDIVISTATGEGVGLSSYEAMAAKRPFLGPNHTAFSETLADGRGFLAKTGENAWDKVASTRDNSLIRPAVDIDDMVKQLIYIHDNPDEVAKVAEKGYEYIIKKDWDIVYGEWDSLFEEAHRALQFERGDSKIGRNDDCFCGSGKKYKKCHGYGLKQVKVEDPKAEVSP